MTTHQCPTCQHEHDTPHQAELIRAVDVLAVITRVAVEVGATIRSAGLALGNITIFVGTEAGLRELAAEIGFLEPKGSTILLETQGDYAGVSVALRHYQVDDQ